MYRDGVNTGTGGMSKSSTLNLPNLYLPGRRPSMLVITDHLMKNTPMTPSRKVSAFY